MKKKKDDFVPYTPKPEEIEKALVETISNLAESLYREQDKRYIRNIRLLMFISGLLFSLGFILGIFYANWQAEKTKIISPIETYQTEY